MNTRTIKKIIPAKSVNMGGHLLDQPLPSNSIRQIDPFLLIHHWDSPLLPGKQQNEVGVGPHPHRGFSPVTFVYKGSLRHQDSIGNDKVVKAGGTQWMHAGIGIIHSERPGKELIKNGGDNEFIQFWVNTPSKYKMEKPYYLPLSDNDTPKIKKDKVTIAVVAGNFEGVQGPAKTYSPQILLRVQASKEASFSLTIPHNYNTLIYLLNGQLEINQQTAKNKDMIWFNNDSETIKLKVNQTTQFIVLSGEPIAENISTYGPFVMNTEQEIQQAIMDYQNGKMGKLIENIT